MILINNLRRIKLDWIIILTIMAVVFIPSTINGELFKPINVDTYEHVKVFNGIENGNAQYLYLGQRLIGYPLIWLSNITKTDIMNNFIWFNYIALTGAMITYYLVASKLINKTAG